jgi:predicted small metal-binding protein
MTNHFSFRLLMDYNSTFNIWLMEKVIHCRDVGYDCDGVIRAQTEEEALNMAAEHAKNVHGLQEVTPVVVEKIKSVMHEEPSNSK